MPDPYNDPDSQFGTAIQAMITRLEERGRHAGFRGMIDRYIRTIPSDRPQTILDLGCGTGVVTRLLAEAAHPDSAVHGADVSGELLAEAGRLSANPSIRWDHLSIGKLPYDCGSFDVVAMHTLLSHVARPDSILAECRRILKAGGALIVFDADHAGTTYVQPDFALTRRMDHLLSSAIATHPDICRKMPRLLKAAGFQLTGHSEEIIAECGHGDYWLSSVRGFARLLPTLDVVSPQEAEAWVGNMLDSHENGTFFAAGAFYTFHATPA